MWWAVARKGDGQASVHVRVETPPPIIAPLRAAQYEKDPDVVRSIIAEGCEAARETARETLHDVRSAMGLTSW